MEITDQLMRMICQKLDQHTEYKWLIYGTKLHKDKGLWGGGGGGGNSPVAGEFPTQRASNAGNVSIWWRHMYGVEMVMWIPVLARWLLYIKTAPGINRQCVE